MSKKCRLVAEALAKAFGCAAFKRMAAGEVLPLKLGVYHELAALRPDLAKDEIHRLLGRITGLSSYYAALRRPGARRHDLEGNPVAEVSDHHRDWAKQVLKKRRQARRALHGGAGQAVQR